MVVVVMDHKGEAGMEAEMEVYPQLTLLTLITSSFSRIFQPLYK